MKIEITEKGSEAFYREVVNITAQYRGILKNHHYRLKDYFKQFRVLLDYFKQFRLLLILGAAILVILILMAISWGAKPFQYAVIGALGIEVVMCAVYLYALNKMLRTMMADSVTTVITLDDTGVEFNKVGAQIIKLAWDNIAVVRVFQESLTFVSADRKGFVIAIAKQYAGGIPTWLREHQPSVEVIESVK